jgi:hypothetical protein
MRHHRSVWILAALLVAAALLTACAQPTVNANTAAQPARIELIDGTELNRVILSARAAERLDIQTAAVSEGQVEGAARKLVPYSALIYDLNGDTWIYLNPEPLTFVRQQVTVDHIDGDTAVLLDGPPAGAQVVTVGVAELYGADTGIGK